MEGLNLKLTEDQFVVENKLLGSEGKRR